MTRPQELRGPSSTHTSQKVNRREAYISAQQPPPQEAAWLSQPHADPSGSCDHLAPSSQRAQTSERIVLSPKRRTPPIEQKLSRHQRLRRRPDFVRCYRRGRKRHGRLASIHFHPNDTPDVRLGITASRKVGNSVVRHRLKRRVREIFRRFDHRGRLAPMDLVVHLKPAASTKDFSDLAAEIERLLTSLIRYQELRQ